MDGGVIIGGGGVLPVSHVHAVSYARGGAPGAKF
jgi:hypothetical protein